jgi:hypothetical protein
MPGEEAAISAISQGVSGLANQIIGLKQRKQGKKLLREIGDSPVEQMPSEVLQNQEQARINANTGLPSEQYNQAMKNLQRQQMMALRGAQDRRGGLLTLAGNEQGYNDALLNLDAKNAQARLQNQNTLYGVNNNVAGWKHRLFQNNVADKWNRKYQYAMSLLGAGNQNASTGIDQFAAGGMRGLQGMNFGGGGSNSGSNLGGGSEPLSGGQG